MADNIETKKNRLPRSLYAETARGAVVALHSRRQACRRRRGRRRLHGVVETALHLAQHRTDDVTVLEAREPGWGASGRNGGQVNPGLKREPEEIERHFGRDLGRRMVSLSGGAPDRVFALIRELQIRCEANQGGTNRAALTNRSARFLAAPQQVGRTAERRSNCWKVKRSRARPARSRYLCGALDRRGGSLNPLGYARGLAEAAIQAGAAIHGGSTATAVERRHSRWPL